MKTLWLEPATAEWMGERDLRPRSKDDMVISAYHVATNAHAGILRKTGEIYLNHPLRVAQRIERAGFDDVTVAIALMHDAVEDSALTLQDLTSLGFPERVVSGVDAVTKRPGEAYPDAVSRAASNPDGRIVKLSDNLDNSSEEQLAPFSAEKREKQVQKYAPARLTLVQAIAGKEDLDPELIFNRAYRVRIPSLGALSN